MIPELSDRTRGWLRFVWEKATTPDDWSSRGAPLAWWDQESLAPMCVFPRWDLSESAAILPVLCDLTPAWREVYTRIADELVGRHTTFWAAIDWLTFIGPQRDWDSAPPEWITFLPQRLRGRRYYGTAWVANGVEPWGLQPDPVGADGNLFFRGFFNFMLSVYRYVSGDGKWERPFQVTGYQERRFPWTHRNVAEFIYLQWKEQPQGAFCENTKIFPFCLSAAGLGLQLYDGVAGTRFHGVYGAWVEFAKKYYLVRDRSGRLRMFPIYYDPVADEICGFPDPFCAFAALVTAHYVIPQAPEFGTYLYEEAVRKLGWSDPSKPVVNALPDPRFLTTGLLCARELGDETTRKRLGRYAEDHFDPRWFGDENDRFGWWFGLHEPYPRGQQSALLMLCEAGEPGAWSRPFRAPNLRKFSEPTVEGIDYPNLGVRQAWNDPEEGVLHVGVCAQTPSRQGRPTAFRVTRLPDDAVVSIRCDGAPFARWRIVSGGTIEIETDIREHRFRIAMRAHEGTALRAGRGAAAALGGGSGEESAASAGAVHAGGAQQAPRPYVPEPAAVSCACCKPGGI